MVGYFLDWDLSCTVIESPDVYDNVILLNKALEDDTLDLIIDPENRLGTHAGTVTCGKSNTFGRMALRASLAVNFANAPGMATALKTGC